MSEVTLTLSPASIDVLAEKVAALVLERFDVEELTGSNGLGLRKLLSLDELIAELPETKQVETWRRWLYEQVRHRERAEAMGAKKIGGAWHFDRDKVGAWLDS